MKLASALFGIAALGGVALSSLPASAMTIIVPGQATQTSNAIQADYVCNPWHCWHSWRHTYNNGGYNQPQYHDGFGSAPGWGYGWHRWHHWHPWHHWYHW